MIKKNEEQEKEIKDLIKKNGEQEKELKDLKTVNLNLIKKMRK